MHVKERVKLMGVGGDIPVVPQRTLFFCDPGSPSTPEGQGKFPCRRGSFLAARVTAAVDRLEARRRSLMRLLIQRRAQDKGKYQGSY